MHCVIRVQAAERCLLSLLPWRPPNRDAFSLHWLSAGGTHPELVQPEMLAGLLLYFMKQEEEERSLCACDVKPLH